MASTTGSALKDYTGLLLRLKQTIEAGQDDSDEDDILFDAMDAVWYRLSSDEKELAGMISAGLDMLCEDEVYRPAVEGLTPAIFESCFNSAESREDWIEVLRLLRSGPPFLIKQPAAMASFRGRSYDKLEFPELAWRFFDYASQLVPNNPSYAFFALDALERSGHNEEALARAEAILTAERADVVLMVKASAALYRFSLQHSEEDARPIWERIATALTNGLVPVDTQGMAEIMPVIAAGCIVLGLCYGDLGRMEDALNTCSEALRLDPANTVAKTLINDIRGMINSRAASSAVIRSEITVVPSAFLREWASIRQRSLNNIEDIIARAGSPTHDVFLAAA